MNKSYSCFFGILFSFFLVTCCFGEDLKLDDKIRMPSSEVLAARLESKLNPARFGGFVEKTHLDWMLGDKEKSPKEILSIIEEAFSDYTWDKKNIMSGKKLDKYIKELTEIILADFPPAITAIIEFIPTFHREHYGPSYDSAAWEGAKPKAKPKAQPVEDNNEEPVSNQEEL